MTDRPGPGFQLFRPEDPGAAGLEGIRPVRRRRGPTSPAASRTRWSTRWRSSANARCSRPALRTLVVAGGVGANLRLRERLQQAAPRPAAGCVFPRPEFCTDNGAMIAFAGALRLQAGQHEDEAVRVFPRWDMAGLPAV